MGLVLHRIRALKHAETGFKGDDAEGLHYCYINALLTPKKGRIDSYINTSINKPDIPLNPLTNFNRILAPPASQSSLESANMTSELKPLNLYGGGMGPNPWKVVVLLEELALPYETTVIPYTNLKTPEFEKVNPNGRLPALHDPNTDITIWESGAILEYIVEKYDKENKFSFPALSAESYQAKQWLHFQVSGQGPYYGQSAWFKYSHPERIPSAYERYWKEVRRVSAVLDKHLEGRQYFVDDKFTFVDIAFFLWQNSVPFFLEEGTFEPAKEFTHVEAWLERVRARPSVVKAMADRSQYSPPPNAQKQ